MCANEPATATKNVKIIFHMQKVCEAKNLGGGWQPPPLGSPRGNIVSKWQLEYSNDNRGQFYKSICLIVSTDIKYLEPYRHKEVQISRLRLGVANTNQRLFVIKRHLNGLCDTCQIRETIHHLLLDCVKEDISELLTNKCQLYKHEISIKTLLTVNLFQNEVYRLVKIINNGKIL